MFTSSSSIMAFDFVRCCFPLPFVSVCVLLVILKCKQIFNPNIMLHNAKQLNIKYADMIIYILTDFLLTSNDNKCFANAVSLLYLHNFFIFSSFRVPKFLKKFFGDGRTTFPVQFSFYLPFLERIW